MRDDSDVIMSAHPSEIKETRRFPDTPPEQEERTVSENYQ
jgi:hypothetical protein